MTLRLSTFIAVSCLAHASLLWYWQRAEAPALDIGGEARALRVTLAAAPPAPDVVEDLAALEIPPAGSAFALQTTPQPARLTAVKKPAQKIAPQPVAKNVQPTPRQKTPAAIHPDQQNRVSTAEPQSSSLTVSERVSAALQNQLVTAFDYPWLARKRGWQGLVTLSLHIDEDGALSRWKIIRTSGYSLLDRSALQAAQRIGQLQQARQLLNGQPLNLSIPVRYQLLDS